MANLVCRLDSAYDNCATAAKIIPTTPRSRLKARLRMVLALRARACTRTREIIEEFRLPAVAVLPSWKRGSNAPLRYAPRRSDCATIVDRWSRATTSASGGRSRLRSSSRRTCHERDEGCSSGRVGRSVKPSGARYCRGLGGEVVKGE